MMHAADMVTARRFPLPRADIRKLQAGIRVQLRGRDGRGRARVVVYVDGAGRVRTTTRWDDRRSEDIVGVYTETPPFRVLAGDLSAVLLARAQRSAA